MMIHKKHVCNVSYADYMTKTVTALHQKQEQSQALALQEQQEQSQPVKPKTRAKKKQLLQQQPSSEKPKNYVEEEEEPINAIDMVLPEDDTAQHKTCNCHLEITKLQAQVEQLKQWKVSMVAAASELAESAHAMTKIATTVHALTVQTVETPGPVEVLPLPLPLPQLQPVKVPPKSTIKRNSRGHIHASKKEIEKGMWCTTCASCKTVAQFSTDLRACCNCNKLSHFNDDLTNCYHWDCVVCEKKSCLACVKQAGGNKIKPLCSPACAAKLRS